jgi:hypothetical protein
MKWGSLVSGAGSTRYSRDATPSADGRSNFERLFGSSPLFHLPRHILHRQTVVTPTVTITATDDNEIINKFIVSAGSRPPLSDGLLGKLLSVAAGLSDGERLTLGDWDRLLGGV